MSSGQPNVEPVSSDTCKGQLDIHFIPLDLKKAVISRGTAYLEKYKTTSVFESSLQLPNSIHSA